MACNIADMKKLILASALCSAMLMAPAYANDSNAAVGLGGLELIKNDAISMDSEDLYLSKKLVTVKYQFTNTSANDIETLVSFPLPALPTGIEGHMGDVGYPDWKDLNFKTLVNGKAIKLDYKEVVQIIGDTSGKDISTRLASLDWPVHAFDDYRFIDKLNDLPAADKAKFVKEGLLAKSKYGDDLLPNWQVQTHVTRKQIFPAGKTITVEHSYKPVVGGSVGGMLERSGRKDSSYKEYIGSFCADKSFIKGFDKIRYSGKKDKDGDEIGQMYVETWLDYVLKSGANWKGPIKNFRLVVDKGNAKNLVSFCMDGVTKISPTQFEVRKTNFEPNKDLNILIVEFVYSDEV
jgi:opacity protein-like surface antigen